MRDGCGSCDHTYGGATHSSLSLPCLCWRCYGRARTTETIAAGPSNIDRHRRGSLGLPTVGWLPWRLTPPLYQVQEVSVLPHLGIHMKEVFVLALALRECAHPPEVFDATHFSFSEVLVRTGSVWKSVCGSVGVRSRTGVCVAFALAFAFVLAFAFAFTLPLCRFARGGCSVMVGIGLRTGIALS